jgi:hypothetical protein
MAFVCASLIEEFAALELVAVEEAGGVHAAFAFELNFVEAYDRRRRMSRRWLIPRGNKDQSQGHVAQGQDDYQG